MSPPAPPLTAPFVSPDPFLEEDEAPARDARLSPRGLFWRRFKRHRLALAGLLVLALAYLAVPFAEILAPYALETRSGRHILAPPQAIAFVHEGRFIGPFVYGWSSRVDTASFTRVYERDLSRPLPLRFFCQGDPYRLFGLVPSRFHLVCPAAGGTLFLLGTDRLGRDMLSRIIHGARISLTIGLIGVSVSFVLGLGLGGLAGYLGGRVDWTIARLTEIVRSLPELPLWLALAAALPAHLSPVIVYFGITLILGLLDWPGLARAVRGKLLALREEDFVLAARLMGASTPRIIIRHLLPNFASHLIASLSLSVPAMILGETALSYLGLGLRAPVTSWGVLLADAQSLNALLVHPWLLFPLVPVVLTVLAFNFVGDGLRDAADPYA